MTTTPWPRPLPPWFWPWARWRLGEGEFKGDPRNPERRPVAAPYPVPKWAFARLTALLAGRKPKPPPTPPTVDRGLGFWRAGMGVWVTRIDHAPAVWLEDYGGGRYPYVVVPCLYGLEMEPHTGTLRQYIAELKGKGFAVVGSQWGLANGGIEAHVEADKAAKVIAEFGFNGWVMNGEKIYEGGGKSAAYARRLRSTHPSLPFGWSPEPHLALDHIVLRELGVAYMPQAYPLENRWTVEMCMHAAISEFLYNPLHCVPLVQAYRSPSGDRYPAAAYREEARRAGCGGLILYTGNQTFDQPDYWRELVIR